MHPFGLPRRRSAARSVRWLALRSLGRRILALEAEIAGLETQLARLVARAAPRTTRLVGVSTGHASQLLVSAGQNIERLRNEAAFAKLCAAAPKPASSGRTTRHRLDVGGDRQANRALHMIAVCRLRYCERTRAYAARRTAEGLSKREIIRCLKRYIARELFRSLSADLAALRDAIVDERNICKTVEPLVNEGPPRQRAARPRAGHYCHAGSRDAARHDHGLDVYRNVRGTFRLGRLSYDNAVVEAFLGRMQVELFDRKSWKTRIELASAIHDYIELFHNAGRRHSAPGMLTPAEYEER